MTNHFPFRYFKTSPEIIRLAVMMYVRFPLSLRNVENLLHERGIDISHESIRFWWNRFGPIFAVKIRKGVCIRSELIQIGDPASLREAIRQAAKKNDAADAEAICEAVTRPNMRFVPVKSEEQQGVLVLHRSRDLLMRQRTMILNAIRAHFAEFGIIAAQRPRKVVELVSRLGDDDTLGLPQTARCALQALAKQLDGLAQQVLTIEHQLLAWHR